MRIKIVDGDTVIADTAQDGGFLGAYAQTELGHGSNVRGLETTATFDLRPTSSSSTPPRSRRPSGGRAAWA